MAGRDRWVAGVLSPNKLYDLVQKKKQSAFEG